MKDEINPLTNPGHCHDPVPRTAMKHIDRESVQERKRLKDLRTVLKLIRLVCDDFDFKITNRIKFIHTKTGKKYE